MQSRIAAAWAPPPKLTTTEWSNAYRYLAAESSALPGKYRAELTPWIAGIHGALDDKNAWKVVCMKSAQVAWTDGVINNWIGRTIDIDPAPVIGLFAKEGSAKEYVDEKFAPMVMATPRLRDRIDVQTTRRAGNRWQFKKFPGGFLKVVGSNSPSNVKSTPAPRVFVEEPDDAQINVGKQGDSIKLLEERTKTYHRRKVVFGGTPSVKGLSAIEEAYNTSDRRRFWIPCHACGESHVLSWDHVVWDQDADIVHVVYGKSRPETATYVCPHCGTPWSDHEKNRNVRRGDWRAEAPFRGIAGFYINELYSPFPGSKLSRLVERYLEAQHALDQGDDSDWIVFVNSCLGLPYEYASDAPDRKALEDKALEYDELTVPSGGLILTSGIDVQHDRLAIIIRAWGRDEESWLVYWGELYGNTIDHRDPVWDGLDKLVFGAFEHESGASMRMNAISIDSSDGTTSDAVYKWVRTRQGRGVMAIKGSSNDYGTREIFSRPRAIDAKGHRNTKASKHGLQIYMVGTHKAKDLIAGRMKLAGTGPGRMHWYQSVRQDYFEQMTGEVKAPHRRLRGKKVWQQKSGARIEAWDCEVYALHASRAAKVHLLKPAQWDARESALLQADIFSTAAASGNEPGAARQKAARTHRPRSGGDWVKTDRDWIS